MRHVFVIGAARSGTKFTRGLLGASPQVAEVPWDINYLWRHGHHGHPDDQLGAELMTPYIAAHIRRELARQAGAEPHHQVLVEKTVSNCLRVPFIVAGFPDCRLIHLTRNGRDVIASAMRQWKTKPQRDLRRLARKARLFPWSDWPYATWYLRNQRGVRLWGPRYPDMRTDAQSLTLRDVCAWQWRFCVERALNDAASVDVPQLFVRYEDLIEDVGVAEKIAEFAGIPTGPVVDAWHRTVGVRNTPGLSDTDWDAIQDIVAPAMALRAQVHAAAEG